MVTGLKDILLKNGCLFDKYLTMTPYIETQNDIKTIFYITPLVTLKKKKVLILSREIDGSWFESVKCAEEAIYQICKQSGYRAADYIFILHTVISGINIESFYRVIPGSGSDMIKLNSDSLLYLLS